jgi:hypothetical protein
VEENTGIARDSRAVETALLGSPSERPTIRQGQSSEAMTGLFPAVVSPGGGCIQ